MDYAHIQTLFYLTHIFTYYMEKRKVNGNNMYLFFNFLCFCNK